METNSHSDPRYAEIILRIADFLRGGKKTEAARRNWGDLSRGASLISTQAAWFAQCGAVHIIPHKKGAGRAGRFGPLGHAYCETDEADANEATVIENLLSGQNSHPLRVVAFNTAEGWARDVTEDIARAALSKAQSERRSIARFAQEFLERTLGVDVSLND